MVHLFNEVLGTEVEVPDRPKRIISFSPAATETLFGIGSGEQLVGVSAFCARPSEAKGIRKVGSYSTVRPELLAELKPDLILTVTGYQREFALGLSKEYPVYPLELPVSVAGIVDFVVKMGLVVGATGAARDLAGSLLRHLGALKKGDGQRIYVELDLGGPVTFGSHSYITDAIEMLGSTTIYGDERVEWLAPDLNRVKCEQPDAIIYEPKMFSTFAASDLQRLIESRDWDDLQAVKAGRCFITPGPLDFLAHHGPSFITEAIPWLSAKLADSGNGGQR